MNKPNRLISLIIVTNILIFSEVCSAAVYDLSGLNHPSANSPTDDQTQEAFAPYQKKRKLSEMDALGNSFPSYDMPASHLERGGRREYKFNTDNIVRKVRGDYEYVPKLENIVKPEKEHNTYVPVASPVPEPETYAMILAGLGLIVLTARRNKFFS